ncbi:hypothetical protein HDV05_007645 [Chytridiales sp. JEL 0842]|nr:hypothetical protein HDV05_007645 [Chytridiales sp. JEL 0842]
MAVDIPAFAFALLVSLGGIIGYVSKGSMISLLAGVGFGTLLLLAAARVSAKKTQYHYYLGLCAILSGVMAVRFYSTKKFMPAGLVFILSSLMVLRYGLRAVGGKKRK